MARVLSYVLSAWPIGRKLEMVAIDREAQPTLLLTTVTRTQAYQILYVIWIYINSFGILAISLETFEIHKAGLL